MEKSHPFPVLTVVCMGHTVNFIHFLGYALPASGIAASNTAFENWILNGRS
ncbi:MAG TPA: hypothetical protein VIX17_26910 [Pyrinomonadaceae bacterium]